ncbi:hypothetical_protein (plasmid) [Leishmania braziliensis MHOM/BR/75/M2904]|uniref:Hypothetical_protein n=1 Tax=Leishmania braziliensis MHOM/BR/75/M2904 TaxID=420245 RepID=A0A3P3Z336_LEIBR|nr:unnamed protein product [Leishmania braziliensis]SYZ64628.1 hypothetical_protein [Leishmania braziliensis MHOM/BR/75/M2904]
MLSDGTYYDRSGVAHRPALHVHRHAVEKALPVAAVFPAQRSVFEACLKVAAALTTISLFAFEAGIASKPMLDRKCLSGKVGVIFIIMLRNVTISLPWAALHSLYHSSQCHRRFKDLGR